MLWKPINNFNKYEVSEYGDIRRIGKKKNLAQSITRKNKNRSSYIRVTLFKNNKRYYFSVHRLVAFAFIPNPFNLPQIDHKDNNGLNNHISNLQWFTPSQNIKKAFVQNYTAKIKGCSNGGKIGGKVLQTKAAIKYKSQFKEKFIKFHPGGEIIKDACITYICSCGIQRTASIMWKEIRKYHGKCPICTNSINSSSKSLR